MLLKYAGIEFQLEKVNTYNQRYVYGDDGHTYLYTHHFLDVTCIFNPFATATVEDGPTGAAPDPRTQFGSKGNRASLSIDQLKYRMSQPRQQLLVKIYHNAGQGLFGGQGVDAWPPEDTAPNQPAPLPLDDQGRSVLLIESPQAISGDGGNSFVRMPCDARGGPNPISFDVLEFHGERTAVCRFVIETWITESLGLPNFLLYHRWEMTHDIDEHFYTTRTINGQAIFRRDWLDNAFSPAGVLDPQKPYVPDYFRRAFFHPVPTNFKRMPVRVTALEDGNSIRYQLTDEEQTVNIDPSFGITKVEGFFDRDFDFDGGVLGKNYVSAVVRVWGKRDTKRYNLVKACIRMLTAWNVEFDYGFLARGLAVLGQSQAFSLHVDMVNRFAEMTTRFITSGLGKIAQGGGNFDWPPDKGPSELAQNNGWPEDLLDLATVDDRPGYALPSNTGTHGTYLGRCVAAALQTPAFAAMPIPIDQPTDLEIPNTNTNPPLAP